jgi:flagellar assembly protein FliH
MSDQRRKTAKFAADDTWQPWEMAAFDAPQAPASNASHQPSADTLANLQQLRRTVRENAHAQGLASGQAAGHAQGLTAGKEEGFLAGKKEGYEAGLSEGRRDALVQARREKLEFDTLAASCTDALKSIEAQTGQALIALAISIAQQVIRSTLDADPEKMLDIVRDIVHIDDNNEGLLRLRVHPSDLALIQARMGGDPEISNWRLVADESIERGGCSAETSLGDIDATLQTRWQRVVASLGSDRPWARKA